MDAHAVSGITVELYFKDGSGRPVVDPDRKVTNVVLHYQHQLNGMEAYGGYTIGASMNEITVPMVDSGDGMTFQQASDLTLQYAGVYQLTGITYKMEGDILDRTATRKTTSKADKFTVSSAIPYVKVSAVSYTGSHTAIKGDWVLSQYNATSSKTDYSAILHTKGTAKYGGLSCSAEQAWVELQLVNAGEAATATLTFAKSGGGDVLLQTGTSNQSDKGNTTGFAWTKGTDICRRYLGWIDIGGAHKRVYIAGELKASKLVLTYNNVNYEFNLENEITINNPNS